MLSNSVEAVKQLYPEFKFWSGFVGTLWLVFKGFQWIKEIKTKDLASLNDRVTAVQVGLTTGLKEVKDGLGEIHTEMKDQTTSIVGELKELRADFRTYNLPRLAKAAAARKRKK